MNAEIKKLLCLRIKNFRESTKLSQEKFCEKAEIDVRTMSNIENCRSFPSFETVCSIINAYKLEPNKLLDFIKYDKTEEDALDLLIFFDCEHLASENELDEMVAQEYKKLPLNKKRVVYRQIQILNEYEN